MKGFVVGIFVILFIGLIGKVMNQEERIRELSESKATVATIDLTEKTVMAIAALEQKVDMLEIRVEELEISKETK